MNKMLAYQRESFSDLSNCVVNYTHELPRGQHSITLVTAYWPLGDREKGPHPSSHYLGAAKELFDTPLPLFAVLDPSVADELEEQRRKRGLKDRTHIVRASLESLPMVAKHLETVRKNRERHNPTADARNTPSVHLVTVSKPTILRWAIEANPFETAAFAWVDFGAARSAFDSQKFEHDLVLDRLKKTNVDASKVTVLAVDAVGSKLLDTTCAALESKDPVDPKSLEYWRRYNYFFAGTVVTMGGDVGRTYCDAMDHWIERGIACGVGHGEEAFIALVYHRNPEMFRVAAGDY